MGKVTLTEQDGRCRVHGISGALTAPVLSLLPGRWHKSGARMTERFDCHHCEDSLFGRKYILREERPYCVACFEALFASTCEECGKLIGCDCKVYPPLGIPQPRAPCPPSGLPTPLDTHPGLPRNHVLLSTVVLASWSSPWTPWRPLCWARTLHWSFPASSPRTRSPAAPGRGFSGTCAPSIPGPLVMAPWSAFLANRPPAAQSRGPPRAALSLLADSWGRCARSVSAQ